MNKPISTPVAIIIVLIVFSISIGFILLTYLYMSKDEVVSEELGYEIEEKLEEKTDTSNWKIYRNEEYGFEIKYPKDWYIKETKDPLVAGVPNTITKFIVNFESYPENDGYYSKDWQSISFRVDDSVVYDDYYGEENLNFWLEEMAGKSAKIEKINVNSQDGVKVTAEDESGISIWFYTDKNGYKYELFTYNPWAEYSETKMFFDKTLSTLKFIEIENWNIYRDKKQVFEIKYPSDYTVIRESNSEVVFAPRETVQYEEEEDYFWSTVSMTLRVDENPNNLSIEDFYDGNPGYNYFGEDGVISSEFPYSEQVKLDTINGKEVIILNPSGTYGVESCVIASFNKYLVSIYNFNGYHETIESMFKTFKFIE